MPYYVYELLDPRTDTVFYVGKGTRNRIDQHEIEARKGRVSRKCDLIREIEASGRWITKREVKTFADEIDAYLFEAELIATYGLERLTNVLPGGGSPRGVPLVSKDREMVDAASKLIARTGNGQLRYLRFLGQQLDLTKVIGNMRDAVSAIAARRGLDWVNKIAIRHSIEFAEPTQ